LALKRDVEAHQTRREAGWNPEARSLARFPPLVCNSPEREWRRGEDGTRVVAARRQQVTLDTYTQRQLMPVKRAAQRKVIEMIVPICSQKSQMTTCKYLIVQVGRVAQLVEQCPFKAWVAGSSPAALTIIF
jgi:hypothetical protein